MPNECQSERATDYHLNKWVVSFKPTVSEARNFSRVRLPQYFRDMEYGCLDSPASLPQRLRDHGSVVLTEATGGFC